MANILSIFAGKNRLKICHQELHHILSSLQEKEIRHLDLTLGASSPKSRKRGLQKSCQKRSLNQCPHRAMWSRHWLSVLALFLIVCTGYALRLSFCIGFSSFSFPFWDFQAPKRVPTLGLLCYGHTSPCNFCMGALASDLSSTRIASQNRSDHVVGVSRGNTIRGNRTERF